MPKPSVANNKVAVSPNAVPKNVGVVTKAVKGPTINDLRNKQGDFGLTPKQRVAQGQARDRQAGRAQRPS